jgi:hypothetical protein
MISQKPFGNSFVSCSIWALFSVMR